VFTRKFGKQAKHVIKVIACEVASRLPPSPIIERETLPINVYHDSPLTTFLSRKETLSLDGYSPRADEWFVAVAHFCGVKNCAICRDYSEMLDSGHADRPDPQRGDGPRTLGFA
jgi:hypothetical protein